MSPIAELKTTLQKLFEVVDKLIEFKKKHLEASGESFSQSVDPESPKEVSI